MILIVDDDDSIREALGAYLRTDGFKVGEATNGQEALTILRSGERVRIVFCDIQMPVLDGRGFCRAWRADPQLSSIPVYLISGEVYLREIARQFGVSGYIKKPTGLEEILAAIAANP